MCGRINSAKVQVSKLSFPEMLSLFEEDGKDPALKGLRDDEKRILLLARDQAAFDKCKADPSETIPFLIADINDGHNIVLGCKIAHSLAHRKAPLAPREEALLKDLQEAIFTHYVENGQTELDQKYVRGFLKDVYGAKGGQEKISIALSLSRDEKIHNLTVRIAFAQKVDGSPLHPELENCLVSDNPKLSECVLKHLITSTEGPLNISLEKLPDDVLVKAIVTGEGHIKSQKLHKLLTELYGRKDESFEALLEQLRPLTSQYHVETYMVADKLFAEQRALREKFSNVN
jgi:hypothetical protein